MDKDVIVFAVSSKHSKQKKKPSQFFFLTLLAPSRTLFLVVPKFCYKTKYTYIHPKVCKHR